MFSIVVVTYIHSIYNQLSQLKTKFMNILCNEGDFKSVNEGDLGLPRRRDGYEGDWSKMREPPPYGGVLAAMLSSVVFVYFFHSLSLHQVQLSKFFLDFIVVMTSFTFSVASIK